MGDSRSGKPNSREPRENESSIYTDWANHHLEKTGVKKLIQDLPRDISDGVLLAEIVEFVCGKSVEKIHPKPRTAKQKLLNIERCLKVLEANRVVLNDVTLQGLYRADLKSVLALFFHLSRYKQREKDFIMADSVKSSQKRCLRPPSTVGRKSRSFSANDKNRINLDISKKVGQSKTNPVSPIEAPTKSFGTSPSRAPTPGAQVTINGWRSKSMNAKHTATTRLLAPKTVGPTLQTFKPESVRSNKSGKVNQDDSSQRNNAANFKKPSSVSRISSPPRAQVVKKAQVPCSNGVDARSNGDAKSKAPRTVKSSSLTKPPSKNTAPVSRTSNRSLDRPKTVASVRSVPSPTTLDPETKILKNGSKPTSMISRLRKLGSPTSTPTGSKSRPISASKVALDSVSPSSTLKKRADSCPPTSRNNVRSLSQHKQQISANGVATANQRTNLTAEKTNKAQPGLKSVKSSLGKALRSSKTGDKKSVTSKTNTSASKTNRKSIGITKSEICPIIPMVTNANQPVEPFYTHVTDMTESLANAVCTGASPAVNDVMERPPSSDRIISDVLSSCQSQVKPVSISMSPPRHASKAHKTATVAPMMRHTATEEATKIETIQKPAVNDSAFLTMPEKTSKFTTNAPIESREVAVKGIADLRHNLEATMSSLRNTQLRHRHGDTLQRRISAQLDEDAAEPCHLSRSSVLYRSHHNLTGNRTAVHMSYGSNAPKLHAGETLGQHAEYKFGPGQFSSLQRTRSARYSRSSWGESSPNYRARPMGPSSALQQKYANTEVVLSDLEDQELQDWIKTVGSDEEGSESSGNLSDFIEELSSDGLSFPHNSPIHQMKMQNSTEQHGEQKRSRSRLESRLSKSTMDIESNSKSLKLLKKKAMAKPMTNVRAPGSSAVGSRLASNLNSSPSASPSQQAISNVRTVNSYRSLPRPGKVKLSEAKAESYNPSQQSGRLSVAFKRSPSLQKLLGLGKSKQNLTESNDGPPTVLSNPHVTSPSSKPSNTTTDGNNSSRLEPRLSNAISSDDTQSQSRKKISNFNSLGRPKKSSRENSPLSYLSLPRKQRAQLSVAAPMPVGSLSTASTVMTWSPAKRNNANSAYSITPDTENPFTNLLSSPALNIDNKESINYSDPEKILLEANPDAFKGEVSDWPLPTLITSLSLSGSNPNVASASVDSSSSARSFHSKAADPNFNTNTYRSSMMASTPSLCSNKPKEDTMSIGENVHSQLFSHAQSVSAFKDNLSGIGDNFRHLTKEIENTDDELQKLKSNIENRMKNNSPDGVSSIASASILRKKASSGSVTSINSAATASSVGSTEDGLKKRKKNWFRESLKTAFGKRKSRLNLATDLEEESSTQSLREEDEEVDVVAQLKEELLKKERKLTDIRLEALTSQHQLHQMQDAMHKMKSEIETLRQENERLNKLGPASSDEDQANTETDNGFSSFTINDHLRAGDKKIMVKVELPDHMIDDDTDERTRQSVIGVCHIANSIGWLELDQKVQLVFQNFCQNISPSSLLGLDTSSILSYKVGEAARIVNGEVPDLLPCGYIIGKVDSLVVKLKDGNTGDCDSLAFELLMDRETVERYVHLVVDHGRVMLSGPAGTGKSNLANRLAEHIVRINPKCPGRKNIVRLDLKHQNENEIVEHLHQLSEDCSKPESSGKNVPIVLVLDDLHRSAKLKEAIIPLLTSAAHSQLPYLIGVAEQDNKPGLLLHQEFRWILCSNHAPPVLDYLSRALRRSLCHCEATKAGVIDEAITKVVYWLPECWKYINKCIETHNSADVTLGPRLFASCPMNAQQALAWFKNIWNFSLVPYIISAVKQGSRRKGSNTEWRDPLEWARASWPWNTACDLLPIRAEDVAFDNFSGSNPTPSSPALLSSQSCTDPLLNMMLKLQEAAASYESDASHDESFEKSLDKALGDLS